MKITIETDDGTAKTIQPALASGATSTPFGQTGIAAAGTGFSLSDLLAKAASMDATNAGPGPSLNDASKGPAPIAASVRGGQADPSMLTSSAGSPPSHVYGPKGGCQ